jgi:hypothetical protein
MNDLMTLDDIAQRWQIKREQARRNLVKLPTFPDPAPGSTRKQPRWRSADIEQFLAGPESALPQNPH